MWLSMQPVRFWCWDFLYSSIHALASPTNQELSFFDLFHFFLSLIHYLFRCVWLLKVAPIWFTQVTSCIGTLENSNLCGQAWLWGWNSGRAWVVLVLYDLGSEKVLSRRSQVFDMWLYCNSCEANKYFVKWSVDRHKSSLAVNLLDLGGLELPRFM